MNQEEEDMKRVREACATLGEFFDTVQIFCTRLSDEIEGSGGTVNIHYGKGNWFTRYGHVKHWMIKQDEEARIDVRESRKD